MVIEKEKKEKKGFNWLMIIAMLICLLFAMFALLNVTSIQQECKEHYLDYIDSNCKCGESIDYGIGGIENAERSLREAKAE